MLAWLLLPTLRPPTISRGIQTGLGSVGAFYHRFCCLLLSGRCASVYTIHIFLSSLKMKQSWPQLFLTTRAEINQTCENGSDRDDIIMFQEKEEAALTAQAYISMLSYSIWAGKDAPQSCAHRRRCCRKRRMIPTQVRRWTSTQPGTPCLRVRRTDQEDRRRGALG